MSIPGNHSTARRRNELAWVSKRPYLVNGELRFNGRTCKVVKKTKGNSFLTYTLRNRGFIRDLFTQLNNNLLLKIVSPEKAPVKPQNPSHPLVKGVRELDIARRFDIPTPICYTRPDTYNSSNPDEQNDGGFFIMEKIPYKARITWANKTEASLTDKEQNILNLVVKILNIHINERREIISALYPKNVMVRKDDTPVVIKAIDSNPEGTLEKRTQEKIRIWSGGNASIEQMIRRNLPENWERLINEAPAQQ